MKSTAANDNWNDMEKTDGGKIMMINIPAMANVSTILKSLSITVAHKNTITMINARWVAGEVPEMAP